MTYLPKEFFTISLPSSHSNTETNFRLHGGQQYELIFKTYWHKNNINRLGKIIFIFYQSYGRLVLHFKVRFYNFSLVFDKNFTTISSLVNTIFNDFLFCLKTQASSPFPHTIKIYQKRRKYSLSTLNKSLQNLRYFAPKTLVTYIAQKIKQTMLRYLLASVISEI